MSRASLMATRWARCCSARTWSCVTARNLASIAFLTASALLRRSRTSGLRKWGIQAPGRKGIGCGRMWRSMKASTTAHKPDFATLFKTLMDRYPAVRQPKSTKVAPSSAAIGDIRSTPPGAKNRRVHNRRMQRPTLKKNGPGSGPFHCCGSSSSDRDLS